MVTVLPFLMLGVAAWQVWGSLLAWHDLVVFGAAYVVTGFGVTVGFHRHLTHRSFQTSRGLRVTLAILGSAAIEGPVISWVADHRKHHAFSDEQGDPHTPHVDHGGGLAVHGLARWQLDPSAWLIRTLERLGLVWDVVRISPERQRAQMAALAAGRPGA